MTRNTITINGKSLSVWHRSEPGALGRSAALAKAEAEVDKAAAIDKFDRIADLFLVYLGTKEVSAFVLDDTFGNAGIDKAWLFANLSQDIQPALIECVMATGMVMKKGEAVSP